MGRDCECPIIGLRVTPAELLQEVPLMYENLLEEVKKEFPHENSLQELHLIRLQIREETRGLSPQEYIRYIRDIAETGRKDSADHI